MHILYYGVFDGKDWRSEYPMLTALEGLRDSADTVNYRSRLPGTIRRGWKRYGAKAELVFVQNGIPMSPRWPGLWADKPYLLFASEFGLEEHLPLLTAPRRPDFVIAHAERTVAFCREQGLAVERLPNAFNPAFYHALELPYRYDVMFIGGMTPRREKLLGQLREKYGERFYLGKNWDPREVNKLYNQARIVFHVHAKEERYLPTRLFEVLPTRAVFVSESFGANVHPLVAPRGYVSYDTLDEAITTVDRLLANESERLEVLTQAHAEAPNHTWAARMHRFSACFEQAITQFQARRG
ncbi:MAG: glycosyltransferase [Candidatus Sericytochromatia bacterium]